MIRFLSMILMVFKKKGKIFVSFDLPAGFELDGDPFYSPVQKIILIKLKKKKAMKYDIYLIKYRSGSLRLSTINLNLSINTALVLKFNNLDILFALIESHARVYPLHLIFSPVRTKYLKDYTRLDLTTDWNILFRSSIDTQLMINFNSVYDRFIK